MASAWGNVFSSLGESADRRAAISREERQRAEDKAFQLKQFLAQEEQRHQDQADRTSQRTLQLQGIKAANMVPGQEYDPADIEALGPFGAGRTTPGMTVPPPGDPDYPQGSPRSETTAPQPNFKSVWKPSWEQQQQIDQRAQHTADVDSQHAFEEKILGITQSGQANLQKGQETFQAGQNSLTRAFQAQQTGRELAARTNDIKLQLGPKLTTQQTIGIHMLEQASKLLDPDEMKKMADQAYGLLGVTNPLGVGGGAGGEGDRLGLHGPAAPVAPAAPPNVNQFLDKNAPPNSMAQPQSKRPLGWEEIQRIMGNLPRR